MILGFAETLSTFKFERSRLNVIRDDFEIIYQRKYIQGVKKAQAPKLVLNWLLIFYLLS